MKIKGLIMAAIMMVAMAIPASAQFRFGPRIGLNVSDLHFNESTFNGGNRAGFTGGIMTEFTVPVIGVGFDASIMYVRRNSWNEDQAVHRDYIDIPINLKWKIGVPVIGKIVTPYLATGPAFAFLTSNKHILSDFRNKTFDLAWNFGFGVTLLNHIQVGASYGLGLTKAAKKIGAISSDSESAKDRYWTITAAYLF